MLNKRTRQYIGLFSAIIAYYIIHEGSIASANACGFSGSTKIPQLLSTNSGIADVLVVIGTKPLDIASSLDTP